MWSSDSLYWKLLNVLLNLATVVSAHFMLKNLGFDSLQLAKAWLSFKGAVATIQAFLLLGIMLPFSVYLEHHGAMRVFSSLDSDS